MFIAFKKLLRTALNLSATTLVEEPRFSCNVVLQTQEDAYKLIQELCSVFRAMPFWEAGGTGGGASRKIVLKTLPIFSTSQTLLKKAGFNYSGSSMKGRPTCVAVRYFDNGCGTSVKSWLS